MSWKADRYRFERLGRTPATNRHHVPPRSKGGTLTIQTDTVKHRAYHILFSNAATLDECIAILKRDWWRSPWNGTA